jgi:cleavage and polyadenylation specificity factor subunit 3
MQILVHGEKTQMGRLWSKLMSNNTHKKTAITVYRPANNQEVRIAFRKDKVAKVVGRLADMPPPKTTDPEDSRLLNGVLVQNGFKLSLMAPEDLREYAGLTTTTIMCKQHVTLSAAGVDLIKWALESTFGAIEEIGGGESEANGGNEQVNGSINGNGHTKYGTQYEEREEEMADEEIVAEKSRSFLVMGCVKVTWTGRSKEIELEWEGNTMNDGITDAVMAVLLTVESSPAAVKYSSSKHSHSHHDHAQGKPQNIHASLTPEERFSRLCMFLEEQFGQSIMPIEHPKLRHNEVKQSEIDEVKSEDDEEEDMDEMEARERARLASLGIPVPGLEIKVDKHVAKLWLEDLEVECANAVLRDRVKAVVERAVETVAPLWTVK